MIKEKSEQDHYLKCKQMQIEIRKKPVKEKLEFILPKANENNNRLYDYLIMQRGLSLSVIDYFINQGLLYESKERHNIIFIGNDVHGVTRFASQRGTCDKDGKSFKCDVEGNDKHYTFHITDRESSELKVFESAIDLMSFVDIYEEMEGSKLALGMVEDTALERYLQEHDHVKKIIFCLDNDKVGRIATEKLMKKYQEQGYEVGYCPPPEKYKDFNEHLVDIALCNQRKQIR